MSGRVLESGSVYRVVDFWGTNVTQQRDGRMAERRVEVKDLNDFRWNTSLCPAMIDLSLCFFKVLFVRLYLHITNDLLKLLFISKKRWRSIGGDPLCLSKNKIDPR